MASYSESSTTKNQKYMRSIGEKSKESLRREGEKEQVDASKLLLAAKTQWEKDSRCEESYHKQMKMTLQ